MLKTMLAGAMLVAATPAMATDWIFIDAGGKPGDRASFVIDRDSIVSPTAGTRQAVMMIVGYAFTARAEIEIDCPANRWRSLKSELRNDGEEAMLRGPDSEWHSGAESLGSVIAYVCADEKTRAGGKTVLMGADDPVPSLRKAMRAADEEK